MIREISRIGALAIVAGLIAASALVACGGPAPTAAPSTEPAPVVREPQVIGCIDILEAECRRVAARIVETLPPDRGIPFAVEIHLGRCADDAPACPKSLTARLGRATVEFANGGEPILVSLVGPPAALQIEAEEQVWSGPTEPSSEAAGGPGPFLYDTGHCGLLHIVDFDGSFWVPVGEISGDGQGLGNQEQGTITLVGPNLAEYNGTAPFEMRLARFPGAKRFFLCD